MGYHRQFLLDSDALYTLAKELNKQLKVARDNKNTAEDGGVRNFIHYTESGKSVVVVEDDILYGVPKSQWVKTVKNVISQKFADGVPISGRLIKVNKKTREEFTNSKYTKYLRDNNGTIYQDKLKSSNNLDEIILDSVNYINEDLNHRRNDNFKEFARGEVLIQVGNNQYISNVIIGLTTSGNMVLYDVIDFTPTKFTIKKESTPDGQKSIRSGMLSDNSISNLTETVKQKQLEIITATNPAPNSYSTRIRNAEDIKNSFEEEYDEWDKTDPRVVFEIGVSSDALRTIGINDRVITWDSSKIIKIKTKHSEMTDSVIKQVPRVIEEPVVIMKSKQKESRITMFGEVYSKNKPILVVLELSPLSRSKILLDEIKIVSAYGKDNGQSLIDSSVILYVDKNKKRVSDWEQRTGLYLPVGSLNTNSNNSISNFSSSVNKNSYSEIDLWSPDLFDIEEEKVSEYLEGYIDTAGKMLEQSRDEMLDIKKENLKPRNCSFRFFWW